MEMLVAFAVFAIALGASVYAICATLAPAMPRIVALLRYGPVVSVGPAPVPLRSRNRLVRRVAARPAGSPARAVA